MNIYIPVIIYQHHFEPAMVVVSKINADTYILFGFSSKSLATKAYSGIRSFSGETEDDYLRRTWNTVKPII